MNLYSKKMLFMLKYYVYIGVNKNESITNWFDFKKNSKIR